VQAVSGLRNESATEVNGVELEMQVQCRSGSTAVLDSASNIFGVNDEFTLLAPHRHSTRYDLAVALDELVVVLLFLTRLREVDHFDFTQASTDAECAAR
jgi:hypothetical protein